MVELFDMIAGSETGGIIATSLVIPNVDPATKATQTNKYNSEKIIEFFEQNVDTLYKDKQLPAILKFLIVVTVMGLLGYTSYYLLNRVYHIEEFDERIRDLQGVLKMTKKQLKNKEYDQQELEKFE